MTTALEMGGAFLLAATLLTAALFLTALQLGRLITRDDQQREVEVAWAPTIRRWPRDSMRCSRPSRLRSAEPPVKSCALG